MLFWFTQCTIHLRLHVCLCVCVLRVYWCEKREKNCMLGRGRREMCELWSRRKYWQVSIFCFEKSIRQIMSTLKQQRESQGARSLAHIRPGNASLRNIPVSGTRERKNCALFANEKTTTTTTTMRRRWRKQQRKPTQRNAAQNKPRPPTQVKLEIYV